MGPVARSDSGTGLRLFSNPYDGHILAAQLEQTINLMQDLGRSPTQVIADPGCHGVDANNPGIEIIHMSSASPQA